GGVGTAVAVGPDRHGHDPGGVPARGAARVAARWGRGRGAHGVQPAARVVLAGGARLRARGAAHRAVARLLPRAAAGVVGTGVGARPGHALLRAVRDRPRGD